MQNSANGFFLKKQQSGDASVFSKPFFTRIVSLASIKTLPKSTLRQFALLSWHKGLQPLVRTSSTELRPA